MRIRIDYSPWSTVAVCPCGWRRASLHRIGAWQQAAHHALAVHGDRGEYTRAHVAMSNARRPRPVKDRPP